MTLILIRPYAFHQTGSGTGCDCVSGCVEDCFCAMKNGGEFAYDHNGVLFRGKPIVFECGPFCRCPPTCRNRVSQRGLRNRLEVFRSRETGWGVRSLELIHAGSFVCEYAGVVLTFRVDGQSGEIYRRYSLIMCVRHIPRFLHWILPWMYQE